MDGENMAGRRQRHGGPDGSLNRSPLLGSMSPRLRRLSIVATCAFVAVASVIALTRFDGLHATDAATGDTTRWFVDRTTDRLALIDGYSGTTLARLHPGTNNQNFDVVDGPSGAFLLYRRSSEARAIDDSTLELGEATPITELTATHQITTVTRRGLSVIDADTGNGTLFDQSGIITPFSSPQLDDPVIAPDGALWGLDGADLVRVDGTDTERTSLGVADVEMTLVGDDTLVLDRAAQRARFADGGWIDLPTRDLGASSIELVLQQPGPADDCGWVGAHDAMFCVSEKGIEHTLGLERWLTSSDRLAIGGNAAVVVAAGPSDIIQFNPRTGRLIESSKADVPPNAELTINADDGLVWIENINGKQIWSANQWTLQSARKDDERAPLLGAEGERIEVEDDSIAPTDINDVDEQQGPPQPDNNGIDDKPIAVPDFALVRSGAALPLVATANDYDPDGEAVVIETATAPAHGSTTIASASTISYQADPGFVGTDIFEYTIVDGDGDASTATVTIEVVGDDHPNEAPVAKNDFVETVVGVPVLIDVLGNDYDPERDALQLKSESGAGKIGEVRRVVGAGGSEAIELTPTTPVDKETPYTFQYKAQDAFGAVTDPGGTVTVMVRPEGSRNVPPVLTADSVRAPALTNVEVPVLANDRDGDGDELTISSVDAPSTLTVRIKGKDLQVNAKKAARHLETFSYTVDDGHGHEETSTVLVLVEPPAEANRPPVAVPDVRTAVAGQRTQLDPAGNDYDPDNDEIEIVGVGDFQSDDVPDAKIDLVDGHVLLSIPPWASDKSGRGSFEYQITDGRGHTASAVFAVTILPKALNSAPIAVDDHESTDIDTPVTVNVLLNDYDPSGQEQSLVGDPVCAEGGIATATGGGNVQFEPPEGEVGIFRCAYRVSNPQGLTANARIIITVIDKSLVNHPPEPSADILDAEQGEQIEIRPLSNDNDPDGDDLVLDAVEQPTSGSVRKTGNSLIFTAPNAPGVVSFAYQVSDDNGGVSKGHISVTVQPDKPQAPVAQPDFQTVSRGSGSFSMPVLANDLPSGSLTLASVTKVSGQGSVQRNGDNILFTFNGDATGKIEASYTARAADGQTATANAVLTIEGGANRPPVARAQSATIRPGGTVNVVLNVSDPDNDQLSVNLAHTSGVNDLKIVSSNGPSFTFSAGANAKTTTMEYTVGDGQTATSSTLTIYVQGDGPGPGPGPTNPQDGTPDGSTAPTTPPEPEPELCEVAAPSRTLIAPVGKRVTLFKSHEVVGDIVGPDHVDGGKFEFSGHFTLAPGAPNTVEFDYTVKMDCGTAVGHITIDRNRAPEVKDISVRGKGTAKIPVRDFAEDAGGFAITSVEVRGGFPGVDAFAANEGKTLVIEMDSLPSDQPVPIQATVTDEFGESAMATITARRTTVPGAKFKTHIDLRSASDEYQIAPEGWELNEVVLVSVTGANAEVAKSASRNVFVYLSNITGRVEGSFRYSANNIAGDTTEGTVTFTFNPPDKPNPDTTAPQSTTPETTAPTTTAPQTTAPQTTAPPTTKAPASTTTAPPTSSSTSSSTSTSAPPTSTNAP